MNQKKSLFTLSYFSLESLIDLPKYQLLPITYDRSCILSWKKKKKTTRATPETGMKIVPSEYVCPFHRSDPRMLVSLRLVKTTFQIED